MGAVGVRPRCSWIADHAKLDFVGRGQPRKTQAPVPARTTVRSRNGQLQLTMPVFDRLCHTVEVARLACQVSVHRASRTSRKKENRPRPGKSELEPAPSRSICRRLKKGQWNSCNNHNACKQEPVVQHGTKTPEQTGVTSAIRIHRLLTGLYTSFPQVEQA